MSDATTEPAEDQPRVHPEDPAEGARSDGGADEPRVHSQDPAEGGDDSSATGTAD